ncbi:MAG TPA: glutathione S-transferase family protein [Xanthobacteraceae bacterium]|jgi:glutathione S-transferase|nr:glutathione S-transferase family protein [Xanthobacteraceae bacterium]
MSLKLYLHPLSSFCQKVLTALYESGTAFEPVLVDLGKPEERAKLLALWPIGKFPVLRDEARGRTIPESSIIIEYLDAHHPGRARMIPQDSELAAQARAQDRFVDLYLQLPMQKIVGDRLRPAESKDPFGVEEARARLKTAYGVIEDRMAGKTWAVGDAFTMADCAAAPALFYANKVQPFGEYKAMTRYHKRLMERPSYKRALEEAKPYFHLFPE